MVLGNRFLTGLAAGAAVLLLVTATSIFLWRSDMGDKKVSMRIDSRNNC